MKSTFEQIKQWTIDNQNDIILVVGVILISLLSFAMGYIVARQQEKEPLKVDETSSHLDPSLPSEARVIEYYEQ